MIGFQLYLLKPAYRPRSRFHVQSVKSCIVVKTASVIDFVFRGSNENMVVPFIAEIPDVADRDVHKLVLTALDKGGKAIVISAYIDELPVIFFAHCFQVVDIFGLKGLVIFAGVTAG